MPIIFSDRVVQITTTLVVAAAVIIILVAAVAVITTLVRVVEVIIHAVVITAPVGDFQAAAEVVAVVVVAISKPQGLPGRPVLPGILSQTPAILAKSSLIQGCVVLSRLPSPGLLSFAPFWG